MARREGAPPRTRKPRTAPTLKASDAGAPPSEAPMPEAVEHHPVKRPPGRPPGRRAVAARHSVRLNEAQYGALAQLAQEHGRSIHSLILEAIDALIRKGSVGLS